MNGTLKEGESRCCLGVLCEITPVIEKVEADTMIKISEYDLHSAQTMLEYEYAKDQDEKVQ